MKAQIYYYFCIIYNKILILFFHDNKIIKVIAYRIPSMEPKTSSKLDHRYIDKK